MYAQAETSSGFHSRIVAAKTKVAPIKKLSIPRLELLSCLLLVELMQKICSLLKSVITVEKIYLWSDSEVALAWIRSESKEWKPWVRSRVQKIKEKSNSGD